MNEVTDPEKSFYTPVAVGGNWRQNAVVGGYENDLGLARGFFDVARRTFSDLAERPNDLLFIPAMFNARHAFELALKEGVRLSALYLRQESAFAGEPPDPALANESVEARLMHTHTLHGLLNEVLSLSDRANLAPFPEFVVEVVLALDGLDPTGQGFRYSKVKDQAKNLVPARPNQSHIDVVALSKRLSEAFQCVASGLLAGELGHRLELQVQRGGDFRT